MDLLFSRYASPLDFMGLYINQGRLPEFVSQVVDMENERRKQEAEKESDDKLWQAYIRSMSKKNFSEWKKEVAQEKEPVSYAMTDKEVEQAKNRAKEILKGFSLK